MKKIVIVGGVAGGASTAARLRRLDESAEIIMIERSAYISYANCGLPYYIGGTIKDRDALLIQTPKAMGQRFNLDIRTEHEALAIDPVTNTLTILDIQKNTKYTEKYDTLVLSPGSSPLRPPIPGIDAPNIFSLWTIPDTDKIKDFVTKNNVKTATVIGGGFIGLEMVENLAHLGLEVNLVEMADQVMAPLDFEMAQLVHGHLSAQGVALYLKDGVQSFQYDKGVTTITLQSGTALTADIVILSIGISPNSELAKTAGLTTNARGGIIVDAHLRTSVPNIYALGDAIEVTDYVTKEQTMIPLAGPANKQGRIVADHICGRDSHYRGTQGTSVAKIFDFTVATTGQNEKQLQKSGLVYGKDYFITIIEPKSHAGYYPGAFPMTLKIIFDAKGTLLGAQNIGLDGVDKRIDVIASVMHFQATIYDLQRLELAYAPPYGSAKDPVNMAGFAAENILSGDQPVARVEDIHHLDPVSHVLLDVREDLEVSLGKMDGAIHIPLDDLRDNLPTLDPLKTYVVYCAVGIRGYLATRILMQAGFKAKNLMGGYHLYQYYHQDYTNPNCVLEDHHHATNDEGVPIETDTTRVKATDLANALELDACGLQCPGPIMKTNTTMQHLIPGQILQISATDPGFTVDVKAWCKKTGNHFLKSEKTDHAFIAYIQKGGQMPHTPASTNLNGSTMVVFSGDLDKAIASMIIANGAKAMGKDVTLFFTFWGLNILRKSEKVHVKKSFIEAMFGKMMPRGTKKLKLSNMHMAGAGTAMIHHVMTTKHVETLDNLIASAMDSGVKFVACTMSMDLMGIKEEELIDGVEFGGVAAYLGATDDSNHNLFI